MFDLVAIFLAGFAIGVDAADHVLSAEGQSWGVGVWLSSVGVSMLALLFEIYQLSSNLEKLIGPVHARFQSTLDGN